MRELESLAVHLTRQHAGHDAGLLGHQDYFESPTFKTIASLGAPAGSYTDAELTLIVRRSAGLLNVRIDEEHKIANVVVPERQLSLAIGKEGQNARLAAKLTGWRIDIRSDAGVAAAAGGDEGRTPVEAPVDAEAKT